MSPSPGTNDRRRARRLAGETTIEAALATVDRWGLKTLGEVAALPAADLFERIGGAGLLMQQIARGEDHRPLVPDEADERFDARLDLEWPIDGLEPLSFVLGRLLDPVCARLEARDRGAARVQSRCGSSRVTRTCVGSSCRRRFATRACSAR